MRSRPVTISQFFFRSLFDFPVVVVVDVGGKKRAALSACQPVSQWVDEHSDCFRDSKKETNFQKEGFLSQIIQKPLTSSHLTPCFISLPSVHTVLRLEAEIEAFVVTTSHPHRLFSGDMSSYDRLLTHRTAQHWGLDTSTINQGPDQGCILAVRTPRTGPPPIKLALLPVTMEEPLIPPQQAPLVGGGGGGGNGVAQPKVLVRRRAERPNGSPGGGGGGGGAGQQGFNSRMPPIEDRELHYERARARIFGEGGDGDDGGDDGEEELMGGGANSYPPPPPPQMIIQQQQQQQQQQQMHHQQQQQQQQQQRDNNNNNNNNNNRSSPSPAAKFNSPQQGGVGGSLPQHPHPPPQQQQHHQQNNNNNNQGGGKAQLRNRQEDLSDPDFRRGRHAGYANAPRFDPGYGGEDYYAPTNTGGGMYITARPPTYSSEFPELGGGGSGGRNYPQMMPSAAGGGGGGGMGHHHHHPLHYAPYAAAYPGQPPQMMGGGGGGGGGGNSNNNINGNGVHHLQQQQQQHRQMAALHHHQQQQQQQYQQHNLYHPHAVPPPPPPGGAAAGAVPPQYAMTMTPYGYMPHHEASAMMATPSGMVPIMYPNVNNNGGGGGGGGEMQHGVAVDGIPYLPQQHQSGSIGGVVVGSPTGMVNGGGVVNMGVQRGNGGGGGGGAMWQHYQQRPQHQHHHHHHQQQQQQQQRNGGPNRNANAAASGGKGNKSGGVAEKPSSPESASLAAPEK